MTPLSYFLGSIWDAYDPDDFETQADLDRACELEGYPYTELPA